MKTFLITLDNITKALNSMPTRLATLAVAFSKERFVQQNWIDSSVEAWRPRSRKRRGGKRRQRGAVLVDSGRLKRSIRVISVSKNKIVIGTDVPYAQTHNDGVNTMVPLNLTLANVMARHVRCVNTLAVCLCHNAVSLATVRSFPPALKNLSSQKLLTQ